MLGTNLSNLSILQIFKMSCIAYYSLHGGDGHPVATFIASQTHNGMKQLLSNFFSKFYQLTRIYKLQNNEWPIEICSNKAFQIALEQSVYIEQFKVLLLSSF